MLAPRPAGMPNSVGLVTLTIGGNDAGFGDVMAYCARRTTLEQSCEAHSKAEVAEAINGGAGMLPLEARLQALYTKIKDVTNIGGQSPLAPGARIGIGTAAYIRWTLPKHALALKF
jgi:hypothetical protein